MAGGLVGTLAGGFGSAFRQALGKGMTRAAVGAGAKAGYQAVKWEAAGAAIGAGIGYGMTGTLEGALYGANLGMMGGGIGRVVAKGGLTPNSALSGLKDRVADGGRRFMQNGRGNPTGPGRHLLRSVWEDRRTFNAAKNFFNRWRSVFGQNSGANRWSLEHMIVKQRWYRGANPLFARGTRMNRVLQAIGDSGINLVPIPQRMNNYLFRHPVQSAAFNYGFYAAALYGTYKTWQTAYHIGEKFWNDVYAPK